MCRVMSYNIHSGLGRDKKQDYNRIGKFLATSKANIVLLQEMDTRPANRSIEQDVQDICANNTFQLIKSPALEEKSGWYGNAVLTRFDVLSHKTYDISQPGRQPRNIQLVEVLTHHGPLTVMNTHLGLKRWERHTQLSLICDVIEKGVEKHKTPLLLAGDFNEWQFFTQAFRRLNRLLNQRFFGPTFPSGFPIFSLDRAWVTPNLRVVEASKIKNQETSVLSDHLPLFLDISLPY